MADANNPEAFNQALALVHEVWTIGRFSPREALTCQRLVRNYYRA
jgi:hypothetical protein